MSIRMKAAAALTAAVVATLTFTGCAPSTDSSQDQASGDVTLKVWGWRQEDAATYKKIFKLYEDKHPGVKVDYVPYLNTEYDKILTTGLKDSSGPDVAQLRSYGLLQPLITSQSLVPLDQEVPDVSKFPKAVLDGARGVSDNAVYGVPFAIQTLHVLYNKDTFAKLNIAPPKSWDEMLSDFAKIKDSGSIPLASTVTDAWMLPIEQEIFGAGTYGGTKYLDQMLDGKVKFTSQPWVDSLKAWMSTQQYWGDNYKGTSYADAQALFTSGKAAAFPGGIFELSTFRKANPQLNIGILNIPAPDGSGTPVPGYVDGSFGVSKSSKHQKAALDLVKWMATPEFGQAFTDNLSQISPVPGVSSKDPLLAQAFDSYQANPSPYVTYAYFSNGTPTAWDLASKSFSSLALGQTNPEQAASDIQRGVDQWFKPRG